jgi:hypothetical protein
VSASSPIAICMVLDNDCQSGDEYFNSEDSHCNAAPARTLAALTQAPPVATKCRRGRHSYCAKMGATASSPEHMDMKVTEVAVGSDYDEACFRNKAGADGVITKDQLLAELLQRKIDSGHSGCIDKEEIERIYDTLGLGELMLVEKMMALGRNEKWASLASHTTSATLSTCPPIAACQEEKGSSATTCADTIAIPIDAHVMVDSTRRIGAGDSAHAVFSTDTPAASINAPTAGTGTPAVAPTGGGKDDDGDNHTLPKPAERDTSGHVKAYLEDCTTSNHEQSPDIDTVEFVLLLARNDQTWLLYYWCAWPTLWCYASILTTTALAAHNFCRAPRWWGRRGSIPLLKTRKKQGRLGHRELKEWSV